LYQLHDSIPFATDLKTVKEELEFLRLLVDTDSRSKKNDGVQAVQNHLATRLRSLGFEVRLHAHPTKDSADLLVATLPGSLPFQVTHIGHADSVLGVSSRYRFSLSEGGKIATGPGIADNKGGLLVALRGLEDFVRSHTMRPTLVFVSSPCEETGSIGWHDLFKEIGNASQVLLGFEPSLPNGDIIRCRNGNRWYKIQIKGKPFHAGRFGEPALNAAHEAAMKICELMKLGDEEKRIKVNIGSLKGGDGLYNIICGQTELMLDTRFPCFESRDELHEKITAIIAKSFTHCLISGIASQSLYCLEDDCPPMPLSRDPWGFTDSYLKQLQEIEGQTYRGVSTGGAADINYFSDGRQFCLDGLGPIASGMHTIHEKIDVSSLFTRATALKQFLSHLSFEPHTLTRSQG